MNILTRGQRLGYTRSISGFPQQIPSAKSSTASHLASNERWPDFSPDGRWIAYASDESGSMHALNGLEGVRIVSQPARSARHR